MFGPAPGEHARGCKGGSRIRRTTITRHRFLVALPLLLLGAQRAPECESASLPVPPGPFLTQTAIESGRPVRVEEGAVLAEEAFRYAEAAWRTPVAIRLQGPEAVNFPAGTQVLRGGSSAYANLGGRRPCLPEFSRRSAHPRRVARAFACLVDSDGDGRSDTVEQWTYSQAMHVIVPWRLNVSALPRPIRLEPDPVGAPGSCRDAHRRLKFSRAEENSVWIDDLAVERDCGVEGPRAAHAFTEQSDGRRVYELPPPAPPLEVRATGRLTRTFVANRLRFDLVDGATVAVGGLRLRLARTNEGWTATPLDAAFSPWLPPRCE